MKKVISIFVLWICCQAISSQSYKEDVLFNILKQEVNYYYSHLSQDSIPVSFLSLNVMDEKDVVVSSDMGYASFSEKSSRKLSPIIIIGNSQPEKPLSMRDFTEEEWRSYHTSVVDLPLTNNEDAIKDVIWSTLNKKYMGTMAVYRKLLKQGGKNTVTAPTQTKGEKYYEGPILPQEIDREKWKGILNRVTLNQVGNASIVCRAIFDCKTEREYIVSSEGTAIAQNRKTLWVGLNASATDENGSECSLTKDFVAFDDSGLPSEDVLHEAMHDLIIRVTSLSKAPMAEAYSGPVLFSGEASGVFFHEVLGHRLEKDDSEFKPMIGKNVLPSDMNVTCDPTINNINGIPVWGNYLYDDDGCKGKRVECIKDGIMKNLLHAAPQKEGDAPSNGHGRAAFGEKPIPRQSNLIVETNHPYTEQQLREMFVQDLKQNNKEYGYYIRTVSNGWTTTSNNTNRVSSFNVVPIETYRVYADGRPDSLVRGVSFIGTPLSAFSNIKAAGGKMKIFNGRCGAQSGWIPVSSTSPMLYVSQMETQCIKENKGKQPPFLPYPEFVRKEELNGIETDSLIFRAMADEMKRSQDSLQNSDGIKPYFIDYVLRRRASARIESALGACKKFNSGEIKNTGIVNVIAGNKMGTTHSNKYGGVLFELPDEISYNHIRRELWNQTDVQFKESVEAVSKIKQRAQEFIDDSIPEWQEQPANVIIESSALDNWQEDTQKLKVLADTLSAVFKRYPSLINPHVIIKLNYTDYYRVTSDGLHRRIPRKKITINAEVDIPTPEGKTFDYNYYILAYDMKEIPPTDSLLASMERFAKLSIAQENLLHPEEREYIGPVLFENYGAMEALIDENKLYSPNISQYISSRFDLSSREYNDSYKKIGKKVISNSLSVWQLGNDSVYNGRRLFRYQKYDADGIRPATIELIRNGVLVNQLSGRIPSPKSLKSTGNEWLGLDDEFWDEFRKNIHITKFHNGVIRITSNNTMSHARLVKNLLKLARKQDLEYAYIIKGSNVIRINTKTGKQEELRLNCWASLSRMELMGEIMASKENDVDYERSIIHPQAILLPMAEITFKDKYYDSSISDRFRELKH